MDRVTGIDDPQVKSSTFPNYWEIAWQKTELYLNRPREQMGLAINCASCRDQDQLHIHMACVKKDVREELAAKHGDIQSHWGGTIVLGGHHFTARRITRGELAQTSPFLLLKDISPAWKHMERQTLAVIGQKDGSFVVLDSYDGAHAEDLLDRDCSNQ
jgi:CDP-diacylglycerol pyrophosphatase